jgi:AraC-like DNA-binding protein
LLLQYTLIVRIQFVTLHPQLKGYVDQIFIFECDGKLALDDLKLIVPNACLKLIIPIKNGIVGTLNGNTHTSKQYKMTLAGVSDMPAEVDIDEDAPAGNITVEFTPMGAYRFFNLKLAEVKNAIHNYSDIAGKAVLELEDRLAHTATLQCKVRLVQQYLLQQLHASSDDNVFDYAVQKILNTNGRVTIKELERVTGYSSRWLNMKFTEKLGVSPKNLSSIIRFQQYYKALATNGEMFFLEREFYNYYYDQSHFIKDFKRFTGFPPVQFEQRRNDYDHIFYQG